MVETDEAVEEFELGADFGFAITSEVESGRLEQFSRDQSIQWSWTQMVGLTAWWGFFPL